MPSVVVKVLVPGAHLAAVPLSPGKVVCVESSATLLPSWVLRVLVSGYTTRVVLMVSLQEKVGINASLTIHSSSYIS